jgi:hypothetical protein
MTASDATVLTPLAEVQARAALEPEFRAALLADPRGTLAAAGIPVPESVAIRIEPAQSAQELIVSIPPAVSEDTELSEDALAGASGGFTPALVTIPIAGFIVGHESRKWF